MTVPLSYLEFGSGPPLVILHGLFGSAQNWKSVAQRLGETHHVYALDLRNHGNSGWADSMTYADLVGDVRAFLARHRIDRAVMLGHSVGGKTAMLLALRHPSLVAALIVADIAPLDYRHSFLPYVRAMQAVDLGSLDRRAQADAQLSGDIPDLNERLFILQNLVAANGRWTWRINLSAIASNMGDLMDFPPEIVDLVYPGPALFVSGERSDYVPPQDYDTIEQMFPDAGIAVIPDAGHQVHADQPDQFLDTVRRFLDGVPQTP